MATAKKPAGKLTPAQAAARLQDRKTISVTQAHEVTYWSKKFGITKSMLLAAVASAGNKVASVDAWVKANQDGSTKPAAKK